MLSNKTTPKPTLPLIYAAGWQHEYHEYETLSPLTALLCSTYARAHNPPTHIIAVAAAAAAVAPAAAETAGSSRTLLPNHVQQAVVAAAAAAALGQTIRPSPLPLRKALQGQR